MPDWFYVQSSSHRQCDMTENKTLACLGINPGLRPIMYSHRQLTLQPTTTVPTQLTSSSSALLKGLLNKIQYSAILGLGACLLV